MCYVRTAKCRTHLFVIRPSSGPEMAFLCIPQILLHQGAGEMCTRVHIYTNNSSFLIKSAQSSPQVINHTCQTDTHQVSTLTEAREPGL